MLSVCPLTSSIESVNQFSWYKNFSHLKVTPTLRFTFDFHAVCVFSLLLLSQLTNFHDIINSHIWRSTYTAIYVWFPRCLCGLSLFLLGCLTGFHDIRISHIWSSPIHCAIRLISILSVCTLTFLLSQLTSFYDKNISHLKVTPTLHFTFDFHAVCVFSILLLSQFTSFHDIRFSHIWRSSLHCTLVWFPCCLSVLSLLLKQLTSFHDIRISHNWRSHLHFALRLISMLAVCPLTSSIEPDNQFSRYKNLSHLKVTPTLRFTFDFHAVCVSSHLFYWAI